MENTKITATRARIIHYFEKAGMDYAFWDKEFNMHFGYWKTSISPFNRRKLLDQMNLEVYRRLQIQGCKAPLVLDLGCGLGAVSRFMASKNPEALFLGFTITPWQVEFGNQLTKAHQLENQVSLYESDYVQIPLKPNTADAAFALESACYAKGRDKKKLIEELYRVLKPGARFVVADGFRKHSHSLPRWLQGIYKKNMNCWALESLADVNLFAERLKKTGFTRVEVEDISWKVAPSFAHIPFVSLKYIWEQWKTGRLKTLNKAQINNLLAPLYGMIMGLSRKHFGYYMISGEKPII